MDIYDLRVMDVADEVPDAALPALAAAAVAAIGDVLDTASDFSRWETKALNTLRKKGRATCVFASDAIDADARATIAAGLAECRTPQEVRAVFRPFSVAKTELGRALWAARERGIANGVKLLTADEIEAETKTRTPDLHAGVAWMNPDFDAPLELKADTSLDARLAAILERAQRRAVAAIMAGGEPDLSRLEAELSAALQAELTQAVLAGVDAQGAAFGVALDNASALAAEWAASYVPGAVRGMTDVTRAGLEAAIAQYRSTPMSREDLIKIVGGLFGADRAELIAQTESVRAASQSTLEINKYLRERGLEYELVWNTVTSDECDLCKPLNGQVVGPDNVPPKHPRCRCNLSQRLKK